MKNYFLTAVLLTVVFACFAQVNTSQPKEITNDPEIRESDSVLLVAENMPEFTGGDIMQFVARN